MFFLKDLTHDLVLHPQYFGPQLKENLLKKFHQEVEGMCSARTGLVVAVTQVTDIARGRVLEGRGFAQFTVKFKAIVLQLFVNEVVQAVVSNVHDVGLFANIGPARIFVNAKGFQSGYKYDSGAAPPAWFSDDDTPIRVGSEVRIKILNPGVQDGMLVGVGTMKDTYLGADASMGM